MTTKEAIEIIESNKAGSYLLTKAIQHVTQVAKRFEGAVEVDEVTTDSDNVQDYFKIVMHSEVSPFKPIGTSKTHKLYAIPKPKEE